MAGAGREAEVALQGVVALEIDARDAVPAAVALVGAGLGRVHGRARDRAEHGLGQRRRVARRPDERGHLGLDEGADAQVALAAIHRERDRRALDRDDLADEPGQVRHRAAQLAGEQLEQDPFLLGRGPLVDEHDRCP
jgi:hypothetical protein